MRAFLFNGDVYIFPEVFSLLLLPAIVALEQWYLVAKAIT